MQTNFNTYDSNKKRNIIFLICLFILLIISSIMSLRLGSTEFGLDELVKGIVGKANDPRVNIIIRNNRLPRILTSILCGAGLGISGAILQVILQNELVSVSTIGVSQGASFGAAMAIVVFKLSGPFTIPLLAFLGSIIVAILILAIAKYKNIKAAGIVLAGLAISSMLAAATTLIQYFADEIELAGIIYWTFGDLGNTGYKDICQIFIILTVVSIYAISYS